MSQGSVTSASPEAPNPVPARPTPLVGALVSPSLPVRNLNKLPSPGSVDQSDLPRLHSTGARQSSTAPVKIYIVTKQRYIQIEVHLDAITARDLVLDVMSKAKINPETDDTNPGGWCLFDCSVTIGLGTYHRFAYGPLDY